jgi:hypothetical protein
LWPYGAFYGHLVYYLPFWYFVPRKIWQPWANLATVTVSETKYLFPLTSNRYAEQVFNSVFHTVCSAFESKIDTDTNSCRIHLL